MEATKEFSVPELAVEFDCSNKVAKKACIRNGLKPIKVIRTNKEVDGFNLPLSKMEAIKQEIFRNKLKYSGSKEILPEYSENGQENKENIIEMFQERPGEYSELNNKVVSPMIIIQQTMEKLLEENKNVNETFRNTVQKHSEEINEKDSKIYLLEDLEKRKETEYFQQISELKTSSKRYIILSALLSLILVMLVCLIVFLIASKKPPEVKTIEVPKIVTKTVIQKVPIYIRGRRR